MSETPKQRRERRRAEQAGLTEEQLLAREDEAFRNSANWLRAFDAYEAQSRRVPSFERATAEKSRQVDKLAAWAREAVDKGVSVEEIAERAGRSVKTIKRWLARKVAD